MMRILKKTFIILIVLGLLLFSFGSLFVYIYGDEIKGLIVENLNKNLKTDVEVKKVDFSIWDNFPKASIVFSDVVIHAVDAKNDTLLAAKKVSTQFSLIDLYFEQYRLIALELSDGVCHMQIDNSGRANYIFWNESVEDTSNFSTELDDVELNNMNYYYIDYSKNVGVELEIDKADIKGNFQNSLFDLAIQTKIGKANVFVGEMNLFGDRSVLLDIEGVVNQEKELLNFNKGYLTVDGMMFNVNGSYEYNGLNNLGLKVSTNKVDLAKAINLLPANIQERLSRFHIDGIASFDGDISGNISAPAYTFTFSAQDGDFKDQNSDLHFKESFLKGRITNGTGKGLRTTELVLEQFKSTLSKGQLKGELRIIDFVQPKYEYKGTIVFELNELSDLMKWDQLSAVAGRIETDASVKGGIEEIGKYSIKDWKNSIISGEMKLSDLAFKFNNQHHFSAIAGSMTFNNNSVSVSNLKGKVGGTMLDIQGKFNNLIAFLMEEEEPLFVDAKLRSQKVDLAELLTQETGEENDKYKLEISRRLTIYLDTEIDSLVFDRFELSQLKSVFVVKNRRIDARDVIFNSQGGNFQGDFFIRENEEDKLTLYSEADIQRVDINKLFYSFKNFGQSTLKHNHISGIADARVRFHSEWNKQLEINSKSIKADADIIIDNGILREFKPLESLSKFVELEELKEVKFKQIRNQVLIKDELITLPKFDLFSSAMNIGIKGTHSFQNEIDYHFTLLLNDILGKKAKKPKSSEFGYVEDDGLGRTQLFVKMTGTVEDPVIKYDSKELKKNIKKQIEEEKKVFKSILKEEFGLFKKDTTIKKLSTERKQSPFQIEVDSSYIKKADRKEEGNKEKIIEKEEEQRNKSKFGKFLDKIAKPNEEEFVEPIDN